MTLGTAVVVVAVLWLLDKHGLGGYVGSHVITAIRDYERGQVILKRLAELA